MQYASYIFYLLIIGLAIFIVIKIYNKFKVPKTNCLSCIVGGVKCGKSLFTLQLCRTTLKRNVRKWKIKKFLFPKKYKDLEKPLLYSNIPLNCEYVPLTRELLMREHRFNFGSVVFIDEASLVADSQLIKNIDLNNFLLLFFKLCGHELHYGNVFINSQSLVDVHYSIKRSISNFFYVHHTSNFFFFSVAYIREMVNSEDNTSINSINEDIEDSLKKVFISRKVAKMYDKCAFSTFTDNLPIENKTVLPKSLKVKNLVSFRDWSKYVEQKDN